MRFGLIGVLALSLLAGCEDNPIRGEGQVGRPIRLASGDDSLLPRLAFSRDGCSGEPGGCSEGRCALALVDSLAVFTAFTHQASDLDFVEETCVEVRSSAGLANDDPDDAALQRAVARFRFENVPTVFAPEGGGADWSWTAGSELVRVEPSGVLGGNLLREFAIAFRTPRAGAASISFYEAFPGTERNLADQGRAFLPVQFPGRLVGAEIADRCDIDGEDCDIAGFNIVQGQSNFALKSSRLVLDACVAPPSCSVRYEVDAATPFDPGACSSRPGPDVEEPCMRADDPENGGRQATLIVATGVPGLVLFSDSARRMFGPLDELVACTEELDPSVRACVERLDGVLHVTGWPSAGTADAGLTVLRVRSVALLPGGTTVRTRGPCERTQRRLDALGDQCTGFVDAFTQAGSIADTTPPYASDDRPSDTSLAIIGEVSWDLGSAGPSPGRWITTRVLPETHPLTLALRLDAIPEALQPDGLLGTALLDDTVTILDYTDPNPSVRVSCLAPRDGDCLVAPDCARDGQAACCFGLPLNLLVDFILLGGDETCCVALSGSELEEIQERGVCLDQVPL